MFPVRGADRQKEVPPYPTEWCLEVCGLGQQLKAAGRSDLQEGRSKAESRSITLPIAQAWAPFSPSCTGAVHEAGKAAQGRETRNPLTQPQRANPEGSGNEWNRTLRHCFSVTGNDYRGRFKRLQERWHCTPLFQRGSDNWQKLPGNFSNRPPFIIIWFTQMCDPVWSWLTLHIRSF